MYIYPYALDTMGLRSGKNGIDNPSFNAQCAQAVATNTITDELRKKAAKLLIKELKKTPDVIIQIGRVAFTHAALAANLQVKGSEYKQQTDMYITISDGFHRRDGENARLMHVVTHPTFLKKFSK